MKQITVGELKELLKDIPEDYLVDTEGCDCTGACSGIEMSECRPNVILLTRANA